MVVVPVAHLTGIDLMLGAIAVGVLVGVSVIAANRQAIGSWLQKRDVSFKFKLGDVKLGFKTKKHK